MFTSNMQISQTEKELISRAKRGDKNAYEQLVSGQCQRLYGYLYRMCGSHEDAEDILQEALSLAYSHLYQFKGNSLFSTWLYRIAINACCKALRQRKLSHFQDGILYSTQLTSKTPSAFVEAGNNEVKQKIRLAIARLPRRFAEIITLKELEGMDYSEISSCLNIPQGTVMSRLYRARLKLARAFKKAGLDASAG